MAFQSIRGEPFNSPFALSHELVEWSKGKWSHSQDRPKVLEG